MVKCILIIFFLFVVTDIDFTFGKFTLSEAGLFPGTLWCGSGSRAQSPEELGIFPATDICCRTHDRCPIRILSFSSKYGLFNSRFHTVLHCACDEAFRSCLMMEGSKTSAVVGRFFFNHMEIPCFRFKRGERRTVCVKRNWFGICQKYKSRPVAEWSKSQSFD